MTLRHPVHFKALFRPVIYAGTFFSSKIIITLTLLYGLFKIKIKTEKNVLFFEFLFY